MSALTLASALPLVGTTVRVLGPWTPAVQPTVEGEPPPANPTELAEPLELVVLRVDDLAVPGPFEQFAIVLEGPASAPLDQGTYELERDGATAEPLLLVPILERDGIRRYQITCTVRRDQGAPS